MDRCASVDNPGEIPFRAWLTAVVEMSRSLQWFSGFDQLVALAKGANDLGDLESPVNEKGLD